MVGSQGLSRPKPSPLPWAMVGQLFELGPVSGNFHFVDIEKGAGIPSMVSASSAWGRGSLRLAASPGPCPTWQALPGSQQAQYWPEALRASGTSRDRCLAWRRCAGSSRVERALLGPVGSQPFPNIPRSQGE